MRVGQQNRFKALHVGVSLKRTPTGIRYAQGTLDAGDVTSLPGCIVRAVHTPWMPRYPDMRNRTYVR